MIDSRPMVGVENRARSMAVIPESMNRATAPDIITMTSHGTARSPGKSCQEPMNRLVAPMPVHTRGAPAWTSTEYPNTPSATRARPTGLVGSTASP